MSILYAESSAVAAWLLGEPGYPGLAKLLFGPDEVVTSALTRLECARALVRARLGRRISAVEEQAALRRLDESSASWHTVDLGEEILDVAGAHFPREPVRTLDALHLATAKLVFDETGDLSVLSLDERVRENAAALGMTVLPTAAP
jgi:predicted nucleic acid-binding protein